jgi:hypothetical protein
VRLIVVARGLSPTQYERIQSNRDIVVGIIAQTPDRIETLRVGDVMTNEVVTTQERRIPSMPRSQRRAAVAFTGCQWSTRTDSFAASSRSTMSLG